MGHPITIDDSEDAVCKRLAEATLIRNKKNCFCSICDEEMIKEVVTQKNGKMFLYYRCASCGAITIDLDELKKMDAIDFACVLRKVAATREIYNKSSESFRDVVVSRYIEEKCVGDN